MPTFLSPSCDPGGKALFTNTFAGKGLDQGTAVAVDPAGNIYVAGITRSDDFPLTNALQTQPGGSFIIKLSSDGKTILYSTYFGGILGLTSISALATDVRGNLYVTGTTAASDFPHTPGLPFAIPPNTVPPPGSFVVSAAFITSISPAGDKILYSSAISGTKAASCHPNHISTFCETTTHSAGIALDSAANAYIAGTTDASDLPTTAGHFFTRQQRCIALQQWLRRQNQCGRNGSELSDLYPGQTSTPLLPSRWMQPVRHTSAELALCNRNCKKRRHSLEISGRMAPRSFGKPVSAIWCNQSLSIPPGIREAVGNTVSNPVPNNNGWTTGPEFLVKLNAASAAVTYSALYPQGTVAQAMALDNSGLIHVAGTNAIVSAISPSSPPAIKIFGLQNAGGGIIGSRISPAEVISIFGPGIGSVAAATATPANGFYSTILAGVQVTINGIKAPMLYASANQINAVVPMGLTSFSAVSVQVTNGITASPAYPAQITVRSAQAFAGVLNQDGTLNSQSNPAHSDSIVTFYGTGWQPDFSPLADGQVAVVAQDFCGGGCRAGVSLAGLPADSSQAVLYGGFAPGIVAGVSQFNVDVGQWTSTPSFPVTFTVSNGGFNAAVNQPVVGEPIWVAP